MIQKPTNPVHAREMATPLLGFRLSTCAEALGLIFLLLSSNVAIAHGMSAKDQAFILNAGLFEYMVLGAKHMLTGYDHLLFLFGVMFFIRRWVDALKLVTAFTIGHSITLIFATLFEISANYFLIDAVIALTVCYKAFENLDGFKKHFDFQSPNIYLMVFIFGLIHGFGLSTRLQTLSLNNEGLILQILSFNVGVELGQLAALSLIILALGIWRKRQSFNRFSKLTNISLLVIGALLFLMQMHSFLHVTHADEFPLNIDDHKHIHQHDAEHSPAALNDYPANAALQKLQQTFSKDVSDSGETPTPLQLEGDKENPHQTQKHDRQNEQ